MTGLEHSRRTYCVLGDAGAPRRVPWSLGPSTRPTGAGLATAAGPFEVVWPTRPPPLPAGVRPCGAGAFGTDSASSFL